jgi:superkiller protein 3
MQEQKLDGAITEFGQAVTLARHNLNALGSKTGMEETIAAFAHNNLGEALVAKGDLERAIVELREGLRMAPNLAVLHASLGDALAAKGDAVTAGVEFLEASRLDPNLAASLNNAGDKLAAQGNLDLAMVAYRRALRLNPDLEQARNGLQGALERRAPTRKPLDPS